VCHCLLWLSWAWINVRFEVTTDHRCPLLAARTSWEQVTDSGRGRVRVRVSVRAATFGWFAAHFDDAQTQTVDERVISGQRWLVIMVGGGWWWLGLVGGDFSQARLLQLAWYDYGCETENVNFELCVWIQCCNLPSLSTCTELDYVACEVKHCCHTIGPYDWDVICFFFYWPLQLHLLFIPADAVPPFFACTSPPHQLSAAYMFNVRSDGWAWTLFYYRAMLAQSTVMRE